MPGKKKLRELRSQLTDMLYNVGRQAQRGYRKLYEAQHSTPGPINQTAPSTDPQNQTSAALHSLYNTSRVVLGMITDVTAIGYAYRVQFEKLAQPLVAVKATGSTCSVMGAKDFGDLQPGTMVVCVRSDQLPFAIIIGALPTMGRSARKQTASVLFGSTRNRVDEAHKGPIRTNKNGSIPDFLAGRPFDAIFVGEQGWITETGMRIFIDPFMAAIGGDEFCQVAAFYHDQLLRIAGYNLHLWSAARECESIMDQYETQDWTGYATYPWEQLGRFADGTNPTVVKQAKTWQQTEPYYSKVEVQDDWSLPFHREREFHGYLGQGGKRQCHGIPANPTSDHAAYAGGEGQVAAPFPGLFDESVTLDGRWCVQFAKGASLVKRAAIIAPVRLRRPEHPTGGAGDNELNYKFSGQQGNGETHQITGDIQTSGDTQFNRALGIQDMHAYFFNYSGLHPFFYHAEDYKVYEERELDYVSGKSEEIPPFNQLGSSMYLSPEQYKKTLQIDHRYGTQDFYTLPCGIEWLDDGGLVLFDGYGGEIRMTGGSIFLSAPGDVWLKSGRNVIQWAGWDALIRAKNSFDITATEHDGRIKAEKNLQLLGGNESSGGVLIESRGQATYEFEDLGEKVESGGIMLRSPNAPIVGWSAGVYLRTGGPNITPKPIMLDAAQGEQPIITSSQTLQHYTTAAYWHFNCSQDGGGCEGPSAWITATGSGLPGDVCIGSNLVVAGSGIFDGQVASTVAFAAVSNPFVGGLNGDALAVVREAIATCESRLQFDVPQDIGAEILINLIYTEYYDAKKPGHDDVIENAEFSLRVQEDYRSQGFKLYEDRWQQLGRIAGTAFMTWEEKTVSAHGQETYPYPGKENFQANTLYQQDLQIFNVQAGRSQDRGSQPFLNDMYIDPQFQTPVPTSLNQYLVIR